MGSKSEEIIRLLKSGHSYKDIGSVLNVAKSSINYHYSKLDKKTQQKIKEFRIRNWKRSNKSVQEIRTNRIITEEKEIQKHYSNEIGSISKRELMLVGAGLYWAEGTKKDRWHLQFSNSDPQMVKLMMHFFKQICFVQKEKFYMQLILHKNIKEINAKKFWSSITGISTNQFKKACYTISKSSKNKRNKNTLPFGTLQIRIFDKRIVHKIYGYINGLKRNAGVVQW